MRTAIFLSALLLFDAINKGEKNEATKYAGFYFTALVVFVVMDLVEFIFGL